MRFAPGTPRGVVRAGHAGAVRREPRAAVRRPAVRPHRSTDVAGRFLQPVPAERVAFVRHRRVTPKHARRPTLPALPEPPLGYDRSLGFVAAPAAAFSAARLDGVRLRGRPLPLPSGGPPSPAAVTP